MGNSQGPLWRIYTANEAQPGRFKRPPPPSSRPEPEFLPKTGLNWPLVGGLTQFVSWVLRLGRVASRVLPVGLVYGQEAPRLAG